MLEDQVINEDSVHASRVIRPVHDILRRQEATLPYRMVAILHGKLAHVVRRQHESNGAN